MPQHFGQDLNPEPVDYKGTLTVYFILMKSVIVGVIKGATIVTVPMNYRLYLYIVHCASYLQHMASER